MLKVISANLNGVRSAARKGFFDWLQREACDILCVQELKAQAADMMPDFLMLDAMQGVFQYAVKAGYSGVGLYSVGQASVTKVGLDVPEFDREGRYVEAEFGQLTVVSVYFPSGSSSAERQEAKYRFMDAIWPRLAALAQSGREVVLCGDWNIAHHEIDLKNWKGNLKNSGFLPEERAWLSRVLAELGWVDVYRKLYPEHPGYTWWSNRGQAYAKDVGWRIDYQIATPGIAARALRADIYKETKFSDHAPLIVSYDWPA